MGARDLLERAVPGADFGPAEEDAAGVCAGLAPAVVAGNDRSRAEETVAVHGRVREWTCI